MHQKMFHYALGKEQLLVERCYCSKSVVILLFFLLSSMLILPKKKMSCDILISTLDDNVWLKKAIFFSHVILVRLIKELKGSDPAQTTSYFQKTTMPIDTGPGPTSKESTGAGIRWNAESTTRWESHASDFLQLLEDACRRHGPNSFDKVLSNMNGTIQSNMAGTRH